MSIVARARGGKRGQGKQTNNLSTPKKGATNLLRDHAQHHGVAGEPLHGRQFVHARHRLTLSDLRPGVLEGSRVKPLWQLPRIRCMHACTLGPLPQPASVTCDRDRSGEL